VKATVTPDGTLTVETGEPAAKATWDGETVAIGPLVKADDERRFTLNVIYPALKADVGRALDGHRDFAQPGVVERACWKYMREYRQVGSFHTEEQAAAAGGVLKADGAADLVECGIYRNPVPWVIKGADGTETVVTEGDWLGGFIWTPDDWALIKAGKMGQVSVEGGAVRKPASPEAIAKLRG
jgi:hypothetical protein